MADEPMDMVDTSIGRLPRHVLDVKEIVTEDLHNRTIVTEWTFQGDIVKRDCHVIVKCGQGIGGQQAQM